MTLLGCPVQGSGKVIAIGCGEQAHRRLVDMGLIGSTFTLRAKTKRAELIEFDIGFSAVLSADTASEIEIIERSVSHGNETCVLRKPKRRKDNAL